MTSFRRLSSAAFAVLVTGGVAVTAAPASAAPAQDAAGPGRVVELSGSTTTRAAGYGDGLEADVYYNVTRRTISGLHFDLVCPQYALLRHVGTGSYADVAADYEDVEDAHRHRRFAKHRVAPVRANGRFSGSQQVRTWSYDPWDYDLTPGRAGVVRFSGHITRKGSGYSVHGRVRLVTSSCTTSWITFRGSGDLASSEVTR